MGRSGRNNRERGRFGRNDMGRIASVEMTVCASQNDMGGVALVETTGIEVVSE